MAPPLDHKPQERTGAIGALASTLIPLSAGKRLLVGIDGVDGAGKTTLADDLASALHAINARPVLRVSLDDFHHQRNIRYRLGRHSPEGYWLDSFNLDQFKAFVLNPLTANATTVRIRGHDLESDEILDPEPVPVAADVIVVVDGLFLHREELRSYWDYSVFLDVPFDVTVRRMERRDGTPVDHPSHGRYVGAQRLYFAAADPAMKASLILDNSQERVVRALAPDEVSYKAIFSYKAM
ncbi:uridine kinase [Podospora aff. communis PSN243]|uniref:Uridine kinase n=1 Tax=Podospora aff. communis PSN243 TaxID=3040156 RepID=A0AAV9GRL3_9PEZI|nr:uridine kinase [Podospora aff. communis PSN243]